MAVKLLSTVIKIRSECSGTAHPSATVRCFHQPCDRILIKLRMVQTTLLAYVCGNVIISFSRSSTILSSIPCLHSGLLTVLLYYILILNINSHTESYGLRTMFVFDFGPTSLPIAIQEFSLACVIHTFRTSVYNNHGISYP